MDLDIHIGTILAITGTNGKTTTTTLVGDIIRRHTPNSYVTGNIGFPISDISDKTDEESIIAVETSSFQLETINEFRPKVSAIINITEDHLNRHKTMERYIECKFNITKNQSYGDYVILNLDDEMIVRYTLEHIFHSDLNIVWFSSTLTRKEIIEKILKEVISRGIGLEINGSGYSNKVGEPYPGKKVLDLYRNLGGEVMTVGSDSHFCESLAIHNIKMINLERIFRRRILNAR